MWNVLSIEFDWVGHPEPFSVPRISGVIMRSYRYNKNGTGIITTAMKPSTEFPHLKGQNLLEEGIPKA
jgi:hypothetical protein